MPLNPIPSNVYSRCLSLCHPEVPRCKPAERESIPVRAAHPEHRRRVERGAAPHCQSVTPAQHPPPPSHPSFLRRQESIPPEGAHPRRAGTPLPVGVVRGACFRCRLCLTWGVGLVGLADGGAALSKQGAECAHDCRLKRPIGRVCALGYPMLCPGSCGSPYPPQGAQVEGCGEQAPFSRDVG